MFAAALAPRGYTFCAPPAPDYENPLIIGAERPFFQDDAGNET